MSALLAPAPVDRRGAGRRQVALAAALAAPGVEVDAAGANALGELAFDRTLKVNQQDPEVGKADLSDRLPGNIATLRLIYEAARKDFIRLCEDGVPDGEAQVLKKRIFLRRRKA